VLGTAQLNLYQVNVTPMHSMPSGVNYDLALRFMPPSSLLLSVSTLPSGSGYLMRVEKDTH
jgi:hypothetical protein